MKRLLAASLLATGLALPAFAQSTDTNNTGSGIQSGRDAVGNASILPNAGANTVLPPADGAALDPGVTRSVSPSLSIPDSSLPSTSLPGAAQPNAGVGTTIAPRSATGAGSRLSGSSGLSGSGGSLSSGGGGSAF